MSKQYIPHKGVFEATLKCNLRCKHCGSKAGIARPDELSEAECADLFAQLGKLGTKWLTISGGEPTTRDDWPNLIEAATKAGIRTGMITNAVTLNNEDIKTAKKMGLCGMGLSLDGGISKTHDFIRGKIGHYNTIQNAIDMCNEEQMPFAILTHINTKNINELPQLHELIVKKGAYAWQVQLGTDMGNMSDNKELLISPRQLMDVEKTLADLIRKSPIRIYPSDSIGYFGPLEKTLRKSYNSPWRGCGAGISVIGIESNGNIKGCLSIMAGYNESSDDFVEGNIRNEKLHDIWFKEGAFSYTRDWKIDDLKGYCHTCQKAHLCKGGCTAKKVASGNKTENPMCIHRVIQTETEHKNNIASQAAAVALASILSTGINGCSTVNDPEDPNDTDTAIDTDTTINTDTYTDPIAQPEYGIPDTEIEMPDYGVPDTDPSTDYSMPHPTDTTEPQPEYGIPDTEEIVTPDYGVPMPDYGVPES